MFVVSDVTLVSIAFNSLDKYVSVSLVTGSQLVVQHSGTAGLRKTVISTVAQMKLNDAVWHQLNIEFLTGHVLVAFHHDDCWNETLCSAVLLTDGLPSVTYFGSATEDMSGSKGFVGCMRDIRVNSAWLTPSWLAAAENASARVTGGCKWTGNCEPDPCNGRGMCTDLWTRSACDCTSPFWGLSCSRGMCELYLVVHVFD